MSLSEQQARALEPRVRALVARKFSWVPDQLAGQDDLCQYALLAICHHARRFDRSKGTAFDSWALLKAYHAIQDALRVLGRGSRTGGAQRLRFVSIDEPHSLYDDGDTATRGDLLEDTAFELPDPFGNPGLEAALSALTLDEQSAIALRFEEDLAQCEIGEMLGVSESRVSQLIARGLEKLALDGRVVR